MSSTSSSNKENAWFHSLMRRAKRIEVDYSTCLLSDPPQYIVTFEYEDKADVQITANDGDIREMSKAAHKARIPMMSK